MSIKTDAQEIRDEQVSGQNTAIRVGGLFVSIADDLISKQSQINTNNSKISYPIADSNKLASIEAGAEVNPTNLEIKNSYESNANTNVFTDAEKTKLSQITGTNTGDQNISGISVNASAINSLENNKQDVLVSGTSIKTINGISILGSGNIDVSSGGGGGNVNSVNGLQGNVVLTGDNIETVNSSGITLNQKIQSIESEVSINSIKVGITSQQASDILNNNNKISFDSTSSNRLANTSGINTGDQDISGILANASSISDLQAEQITQNNAIALNTAKVGVTVEQQNTINSQPIGNEVQVLQVVSISQVNYDLITPLAGTFYIING